MRISQYRILILTTILALYCTACNSADSDSSVLVCTSSEKLLDGQCIVEIDTLSSLRIMHDTPNQIYVTGYYTVNDGAFDDNVFKLVPDFGQIDNFGTIIRTENSVYELQHNGVIYPEYFGAIGDGIHNDNYAFNNALSAHSHIKLHSKSYNIGTLYITDNNVSIIGDKKPTFNLSDNTISDGSILVGTIASYGISNLNFKNFGLDSSADNKTEGFSIAQADNFHAEHIIVIASDSNNHNFLVEGGNNVTMDNIITCGGTQGIAIKVTNFNITNTLSYDANIWGFTARSSPSAPCHDGNISNVSCKANLKEKGGGFILMNNEEGVDIKNIIIDGLSISNSKTGVFINNTGNPIKAKDIIFNNIELSNVKAFSFQTFGNVENIEINNIKFKNCAGTYNTNRATGTSRLKISHHRQDSYTGIGIISGFGHELSNWKKEDNGNPYFLQNTSKLLRLNDVNGLISNITDSSGTGTIAPENN